jgi:nitrilase
VLSGYQIIVGGEFLKLLDQSVTVPSLVTEALSEACRQAGVVVSIGVNERDGGTLYNTQLLFDADGTLRDMGAEVVVGDVLDLESMRS